MYWFQYKASPFTLYFLQLLDHLSWKSIETNMLNQSASFYMIIAQIFFKCTQPSTNSTFVVRDKWNCIKWAFLLTLLFDNQPCLQIVMYCCYFYMLLISWHIFNCTILKTINLSEHIGTYILNLWPAFHQHNVSTFHKKVKFWSILKHVAFLNVKSENITMNKWLC